MSKIITVPFGYVLDWLYQFTSNYGVALILFALIVRVLLIPVNAKSKKSMMKMSRLQPRIQAINERYAHDEQKKNEAIQKLQQEEGATMGCGGCLWSLVPLFILIPLLHIVRQPIVYLLHETTEVAAEIVAVVKAGLPNLFSNNAYYDEVVASSHIAEFAETLRDVVANERTLEGINFNFLGIDLGQIPEFNIFGDKWAWDWNHVGALLIPLLSAGSQVLSMWLSQRSNDSVITDKNGVQDKETAKKSQTAQQSQVMMWMMPLMSLWIGFTVPAALSLYWFIGGLFAMVEGQIMTKHYRKVYDIEDAERMKRAMEREKEEAEKERVRAEKRAANPDGITENTSKKKMQQKKRAEDEAARAAAAKEYNARRGVVEEEEEEKTTLSGIPDRPYCKGRAYDPDRYRNTEE